MSKTTRAVTELTRALIELAHQQNRMSTAIFDVAREQRITNLIVRSQISADPQEKARLTTEASRLMESQRRRSPRNRV
ncbi:hypothetical protein [Saccharopolyspora hattusasensis]|uniref:hypothetical protein n=1 Tax=Saccharopolyspora hattusasensis TaxID=1128679 RepID=UPI003D95407C